MWETIFRLHFPKKRQVTKRNRLKIVSLLSVATKENLENAFFLKNLSNNDMLFESFYSISSNEGIFKFQCDLNLKSY